MMGEDRGSPEERLKQAQVRARVSRIRPGPGPRTCFESLAIRYRDPAKAHEALEELIDSSRKGTVLIVESSAGRSRRSWR